MGLLMKTLPERRQHGPRDEELLWNVIQTVTRVDGVVEPGEAAMADLLSRSVPQLRAGRADGRPIHTRKGLLDELQKLDDPALARQLFVIAGETALASGDVNESEDQYVDHLRRVLRVDEAFAQRVIEVIGLKYGRG